MGRGQGENQAISVRSAPRRCYLRVSLSGGPARGWLLDVDDYHNQIAVYRPPGGSRMDLTFEPGGERNGTAGEFLGIYRLVDRSGSDRRVYVHKPGT